MPPPVPTTLQQALDPLWLTQALAPDSGGAAVVSVRLSETIRTMASKARIAVRFADDTATERHYCLKAFLDDEAQAEHGGITTIRESRFYLDIAPRITMRVPRCVDAVIDTGAQRGILIMNDLIADGARFCSALEPFDADRVARSLEQIAHLHAASALLAHNAWLPCRIEQLASTQVYSPEQVQPLLDDGRGDGLSPPTRSATTLFAGIRALAARNAHRPQTLLHGDCHAGNIYRTADGPGFSDWQLVQRGSWALDVAYHVAAVLPVDVAAHEERRLLDHYLQTLRALGGTPPDRDNAWDDYRAAQPYGFFHWAITRRQDPAITRTFTQRLGAGIERHDSYRLLGVR
jgi:aminoglycoside/choline kinase family phosphotransferase